MITDCLRWEGLCNIMETNIFLLQTRNLGCRAGQEGTRAPPQECSPEVHALCVGLAVGEGAIVKCVHICGF